MALLHVAHPPVQTHGGEDIIYFIIPGHTEFWTLLQIPLYFGGAAPNYILMVWLKRWGLLRAPSLGIIPLGIRELHKYHI